MKAKLYDTLIDPVLTYSTEVWTLPNCDKRMLFNFGRKVLRKLMMNGEHATTMSYNRCIMMRS